MVGNNKTKFKRNRSSSFLRNHLKDKQWLHTHDIDSSFIFCFFPLKPVFVITTGKQTTDQGAYTPLDVASYRLQSRGAPVFILGIGKDVDTSELNEIASGPNNVFRVDSFEDLDGNANVIKRGICKFGTVCNIILSFISKTVETITCLSTFHELSLRKCCQVSLRADINPVTVLAFCGQRLVLG